MVARDTFWTSIFKKYFLEAPENEHRDDLLFYVRKTSAKSRLQIPQVSILIKLQKLQNKTQHQSHQSLEILRV